MSSNPEIVKSIESIARWKYSLVVLAFYDLLNKDPDSNFLITKLYEEALEAADEANESDPEIVSRKEAMEIVDCLVFLVSYCISRNMPLQVEAVYHLVNSTPHHEVNGKFYRNLLEYVANLPDNQTISDVNQLFAIIFARLRTAKGIDVLEIVISTLKKNYRNRPVPYYSDVFNGRKLSELEMVSRYIHSTRMLRLLRDEFGSPLATWAHVPFKGLILDFMNSDRNYALLEQHIMVLRNILATLAVNPLPLRNFLEIYGEDKLSVLIISGLHDSGEYNPKSGRLSKSALNYGLKAGGARMVYSEESYEK